MIVFVHIQVFLATNGEGINMLVRPPHYFLYDGVKTSQGYVGWNEKMAPNLRKYIFKLYAERIERNLFGWLFFGFVLRFHAASPASFVIPDASAVTGRERGRAWMAVGNAFPQNNAAKFNRKVQAFARPLAVGVNGWKRREKGRGRATVKRRKAKPLGTAFVGAAPWARLTTFNSALNNAANNGIVFY
jgi:hypothetical protein